jgi:hypothetical protein
MGANPGSGSPGGSGGQWGIPPLQISSELFMAALRPRDRTMALLAISSYNFDAAA